MRRRKNTGGAEAGRIAAPGVFTSPGAALTQGYDEPAASAAETYGGIYGSMLLYLAESKPNQDIRGKVA